MDFTYSQFLQHSLHEGFPVLLNYNHLLFSLKCHMSLIHLCHGLGYLFYYSICDLEKQKCKGIFLSILKGICDRLTYSLVSSLCSRNIESQAQF